MKKEFFYLDIGNEIKVTITFDFRGSLPYVQNYICVTLSPIYQNKHGVCSWDRSGLEENIY